MLMRKLRSEERNQAKKPAQSVDIGTITADCVFTLKEFSRRSGLGEWALRQARRSGLRVLYVHGRGFVRGSDWLDYLATAAAAADAAQTDPQAR